MVSTPMAIGNVRVDISDMKVSNRVGDVLVTYALGSCLGVTMYDPVACVAGMIHCMLPLSKVDPAKAARMPYMFVDTGVPTLFKAIIELGAQKDRIVVRVAGCGQIFGDNNLFKIGERNYTVLRKILWKNNILITGELVAGNDSKTMFIEVSTGRVIVRTGGKEIEI
ncbi:MAG: chemotaxis protein CheD [Thermodesulfobacteriota bacterium]|nr:chemotaxis protein CheD [Thermodesulfobacteriota bacterium]